MLLQLLFLAPAMLLATLAQSWMQSAYASGRRFRLGVSGAQVARHILDENGLHNVPIEAVAGQMTDHYDPTSRVVRLSAENYRGDSLSSIGVAAHEVGHAIQHAVGYGPFVVRGLAVGMANFGGTAGMLALMLGFSMQGTPLGQLVAWGGIGLFSLVVLFQLVNLPVEFDASRRAKDELVRLGVIHEQDLAPIRSVLRAAALTYVAGTLHAALSLAYYVFILLSSGGRRRRDEY